MQAFCKKSKNESNLFALRYVFSRKWENYALSNTKIHTFVVPKNNPNEKTFIPCYFSNLLWP